MEEKYECAKGEAGYSVRVLLMMTRTSGRYGKPSTPPVRIAYLATFLKYHGNDVKVIDMRVEDDGYDYISDIKKFDPEIVGLSFVSCGYKQSYNIVDEIKKKLGKRVIVGGAHASTLRGGILKECKADLAAYRGRIHAT